MAESVLSPLRHPVAIALGTTLVVTALSYALPLEHTATGVAIAFLAATAWLVLRQDSATIRHYGLSLGGLLEPEPLEPARLAKSSATSLLFALALAVVVFPIFAWGFRWYWHPAHGFEWRSPGSWWSEALGQLMVVALPEEAFYRGYLMTALDDRWGLRWNIAGARLGPGWLVSSVVFALGHVLTEPNPGRLAVFFPALVFGWLRARTGSIGAPAVFHALCNLFSAALGRGYGLFAG
jgi:membrane protease YdiL (CAAX protease family)